MNLDDKTIKELEQLRSDISFKIGQKYKELPPIKAIARKNIYFIHGFLIDKYFTEDTLKLDLIIKAGTELYYSHYDCQWYCVPFNSYSMQGFPTTIEDCEGFEIIEDNV